jgi:hypothetical protein
MGGARGEGCRGTWRLPPRDVPVTAAMRLPTFKYAALDPYTLPAAMTDKHRGLRQARPPKAARRAAREGATLWDARNSITRNVRAPPRRGLSGLDFCPFPPPQNFAKMRYLDVGAALGEFLAAR